MPSSKNRLRHLITVFNATPSQPAMLAFSSPPAAANTILARTTIRCSAVRRRTNDSNCRRSSSLNSITNGLCLDIAPPTSTTRWPATTDHHNQTPRV
jgi:hypothetical protein